MSDFIDEKTFNTIKAYHEKKGSLDKFYMRLEKLDKMRKELKMHDDMFLETISGKDPNELTQVEAERLIKEANMSLKYKREVFETFLEPLIESPDYRKLQAIIRNPQYLKDMESYEKKHEYDENGNLTNEKEIDELEARIKKKYGLNSIIYPDDYGFWITRPEQLRGYFEYEPVLLLDSWSTLVKRDKKLFEPEDHWLTLSIDLRNPNRDLLERIKEIVNNERKQLGILVSRTKPDGYDRFLVWDKYKETKSFAKVAKHFGTDESTVRKAYYRAFEDILGEKYDPQKHDRKKVEKEELETTCDQCERHDTCIDPCPDILSYIDQDKIKLRDLQLSDPKYSGDELKEDKRISQSRAEKKTSDDL
jgi:hypothetical protein